MQDRLAALREKRKGTVTNQETKSGDVELQILDAKGAGDKVAPNTIKAQMKPFEDVKEKIKTIKDNIRRIEDLKLKANTEARVTAYNEILKELDGIMDESKKQSNEIKAMLEALKEQNRKEKAENPSSSTLSMKQNFLNTYTRDFLQVMGEYQQASQEFQESLRVRIQRQAKIVKPDATPEEVEKICADPQKFRALLSGVSMEAIAEIEERHERILKLESDMKDILQMFQDLSAIVSLQQEYIDNIEHNVTSSKDYVEKGVAATVQAEKHQISARTKQCCLLIIVVGIVVALLFGGLGFGGKI